MLLRTQTTSVFCADYPNTAEVWRMEEFLVAGFSNLIPNNLCHVKHSMYGIFTYSYDRNKPNVGKDI